MILMMQSTSCSACGKVRARRSSGQERVEMKRRHVWPEGHWDWPIKVTHKHGLRCGQMVWIGGQCDLTPSGEVLHPRDLWAQIPVVVGHIRRVLEELDCELADLVKLLCF